MKSKKSCFDSYDPDFSEPRSCGACSDLIACKPRLGSPEFKKEVAEALSAKPGCFNDYDLSIIKERKCEMCRHLLACQSRTDGIVSSAKPKSAIKLDDDKRKLSLIHPEMLRMMLLIESDLKMAMVELAGAAHAKSTVNLKAHLKLAVQALGSYASGINENPVELTALAMEYGIKKYGRNNWKKGMEWSRLIDAAQRHVLDIIKGEKTDKDSGNPHLAHALASIHMLIGSIALEVGTNDFITQ